MWFRSPKSSGDVLFRVRVAVFFLNVLSYRKFNSINFKLKVVKKKEKRADYIKNITLKWFLPFHSASPYRGRSYRQSDKPGSPPNKTSPLVSLPLHTGCLESGWFLQTAAYQAETTQKLYRNNLHYLTFSQQSWYPRQHSTYPWLKFRGELGLELADYSWAVVSLNEHLGGDSWLLEVLQAVGLETESKIRQVSFIKNVCPKVWNGSTYS